MALKTVKVIIRKGEQPEEWTGTDWWTEKEWNAFNAYVEELKVKGEYLKEEEYTLTYDESIEKFFSGGEGNVFKDFGLFVPSGKPESNIKLPYNKLP